LTSSKCTSKDDSIERGKNVAKISWWDKFIII
jgi:hypothetical protein